jgi:hypothetical protein
MLVSTGFLFTHFFSPRLFFRRTVVVLHHFSESSTVGSA